MKLRENDTTAMSTGLNETYIGWVHENYYSVRGISLVQEMSYKVQLGECA